jgi:hypothetical protein
MGLLLLCGTILALVVVSGVGGVVVCILVGRAR